MITLAKSSGCNVTAIRMVALQLERRKKYYLQRRKCCDGKHCHKSCNQNFGNKGRVQLQDNKINRIRRNYFNDDQNWHLPVGGGQIGIYNI